MDGGRKSTALSAQVLCVEELCEHVLRSHASSPPYECCAEIVLEDGSTRVCTCPGYRGPRGGAVQAREVGSLGLELGTGEEIDVPVIDRRIGEGMTMPKKKHCVGVPGTKRESCKSEATPATDRCLNCQALAQYYKRTGKTPGAMAAKSTDVVTARNLESRTPTVLRHGDHTHASLTELEKCQRDGRDLGPPKLTPKKTAQARITTYSRDPSLAGAVQNVRAGREAVLERIAELEAELERLRERETKLAEAIETLEALP